MQTLTDSRDLKYRRILFIFGCTSYRSHCMHVWIDTMTRFGVMLQDHHQMSLFRLWNSTYKNQCNFFRKENITWNYKWTLRFVTLHMSRFFKRWWFLRLDSNHSNHPRFKKNEQQRTNVQNTYTHMNGLFQFFPNFIWWQYTRTSWARRPPRQSRLTAKRKHIN